MDLARLVSPAVILAESLQRSMAIVENHVADLGGDGLRDVNEVVARGRASGVARLWRWWRVAIRAPALHFLLIGLALFVAKAELSAWRPLAPVAAAGRQTIVITAQHLEAIRRQYVADFGVTPAPQQETALIEQAVQEEILYREALELGLDRGDKAIFERLVEKMRFLGEGDRASDVDIFRRAVQLGLHRDDAVIRGLLIEKMRQLIRLGVGMEVSEADLQDHLAQHRERYTQPARVAFTHVFLDAAKRGDAVGADADALLAALTAASVPPEAGARRGDAFGSGLRFPPLSEQGVARILGVEFAKQLFAISPGRWAGPLRSPYGLHLVWVERMEPGRLQPLEAVRNQVAQAVLDEKRQAHFEEVMMRLRAACDVRFEGSVGDAQAHG